jgi:hypothetical protein
MLDKGYSELQYRNYLVYLTGLFIQVLSMPLVAVSGLLYMPGKGERTISEIAALKGTILLLTLVTKVMTGRENMSTLTRF